VNSKTRRKNLERRKQRRKKKRQRPLKNFVCFPAFGLPLAWRILLSRPGRDYETSELTCCEARIGKMGSERRQIKTRKTQKKDASKSESGSAVVRRFRRSGFFLLSLHLLFLRFSFSFLSTGPRRPQRPARQGPQDHRRHPHPRRDPDAQVPRRQRRQGAADLAPRPAQGRPRGQVPPQPGRAAPAGAAPGHQGVQGRRLHRRLGRRRGQGPRQR